MGKTKPLTATFLLLGLLTLGSHGKALAETSPFAEEGQGFSPALWLVNIYREHISPIDGDRCPSLPPCSTYCFQAVRKHGFLMGWMMTVDRLLHEGKEETNVSPVVYSDGKWKIFDPVQNNDFWWYGPATHHED